MPPRKTSKAAEEETPREATQETAHQANLIHVTQIHTLRFMDDSGRIYQLDPSRTNGTYTLRQVEK